MTLVLVATDKCGLSVPTLKVVDTVSTDGTERNTTKFQDQVSESVLINKEMPGL